MEKSLDGLHLTSSYYEVNGVRLHVKEAGPATGPVLLFLHGFPECWFSWRKQVPYFVEKGYRVLVPDQRGYNLSSKPPGLKAYTVPTLAQDVVELVAALGQKQVYLVGHDWGAVLTWYLALEYPALFHRVVIINVPHPSVLKQTLRRRPKQILRSWYVFFLQIPGLPEAWLRRKNFGPLRHTLRRTSRPGTFSPEELQVYQKAWAQPGSLTAMINWYRALRYRPKRVGEPQVPQRQVSLPVLIIWGKRDAFLLPEMAEASLKRCTNGRLVMFDKATHWVHQEMSAAVNAEIGKFLEEKPLHGQV